MKRLWLTLVALGCINSVSAPAVASEPDGNRASLPTAPPPAAELIHQSSGPRTSSGFHPRVILSDAQGHPVINSLEPINAKSTCGRCHDVGWIASHGFHFGSAASTRSAVNPAETEPNSAPNCFFCHVRHANVKSAKATLNNGDVQWVATATLLGGGLVESPQAAGSKATGNFVYVRANCAADGSVSADQLQLGPPSNEACGACHGLVTREGPKLADWLERPTMTERTGQVFSPARIIDSTMNLKGREQSERAWDIHAERLLRCSDCHFAQNDPRARALLPKPPDSLRFEPRHAGFADFMQRPDHDFARGSRQVSCENCHEPRGSHGFLPHLQRHLSRLTCEACHIPKSVAPALSEIDWSLPVAPDRPHLAYRGIVGGNLRDPSAYVEGFEPAIILRNGRSGQPKLAPVNLITTWNWREGSGWGAPIDQTVLRRALFDSQGHHKLELLQALDRNGDGRLDDGELTLDTEQRVSVVVQLLKQAGVKEPRLVGTVSAENIAHGVVAGKFAIRSCTACHATPSRLQARVKLAESTPPGSELVYAGDPQEISLDILGSREHRAAFAAVKDTRPGYYVLGSSKTRPIDAVGLSFTSLILLSALTHGSLRIRASYRRRRNPS